MHRQSNDSREIIIDRSLDTSTQSFRRRVHGYIFSVNAIWGNSENQEDQTTSSKLLKKSFKRLGQLFFKYSFAVVELQSSFCFIVYSGDCVLSIRVGIIRRIDKRNKGFEM